MGEVFKGVKEFFEPIAKIITAPVQSILCLLGALLIIGAFIEYHDGLETHPNPSLWPLILGAVFVISAISVSFLAPSEGLKHKKINLTEGYSLKRGELTIIIKESRIEQITNPTRTSAIVLPANTLISDDCFTDERTALGSYFRNHFANQLQNLRADFTISLAQMGLQPDPGGQYFPTTTFFLPERFSKPAKLLITISSTRANAGLICSSPQLICGCMDEIYKQTRNNQTDTVYMPLLGSGHGGVDKITALTLMISCILHFSKNQRHIKSVIICIHPDDVKHLDLRSIMAF